MFPLLLFRTTTRNLFSLTTFSNVTLKLCSLPFAVLLIEDVITDSVAPYRRSIAFIMRYLKTKSKSNCIFQMFKNIAK